MGRGGQVALSSSMSGKPPRNGSFGPGGSPRSTRTRSGCSLRSTALVTARSADSLSSARSTTQPSSRKVVLSVLYCSPSFSSIKRRLAIGSYLLPDKGQTGNGYVDHHLSTLLRRFSNVRSVLVPKTG